MSKSSILDSTRGVDYRLYQNLNRSSFLSIASSPLQTLDPPFLAYFSDLSVLFCRECRLCLVGRTTLRHHLARPPHRDRWLALDKSTRAAQLSTLLALPLAHYHSLPVIAPNQYFFDVLPVFFDGIRCPDCPYLTRDPKKARQHRVETHNSRWTSTTKRDDLLYNLPVQILLPQSHRGLFIPKLPPVVDYSAEQPISVPSSLQPSDFTTEDSSTPVPSSIIKDRLSHYIQKEQDAHTNSTPDKTLTSKNKNAFLRNSRFDIFDENKDVPALLRLVEPINSTQDPSLSTLQTIATTLQSKISALIPRLIRPVRLELKEEEITEVTKFTKDLIELEPSTRRVYFPVIGELFVFLVRLLENYEHRQDDPNRDFLETIKISRSLKGHLDDLRLELTDLSSDIFEPEHEQRLEKIEGLLVNIVMDLLRIEVVFETTLEYTTFRNPMILFLILQSITPRDQSFKSEQFISKHCSILIYASRLFLLGSVWKRETQTNSNDSTNLSISEYYRQNLRWVTVNAGHNYFTEIARIRRYLLKILKERVSVHQTILDLGADTYLVYEKKYTFTGICELHRRVDEQLRQLLFNRLLLLSRRELPRLNLSQCEDDSSISTEGYCLADNPSFQTTRDSIRYQLHDSTSSVYRSLIQRVDSNNKRYWRKATITDFFEARQSFIKLFLLAAHLASGSPLRGTEWEFTTFRNLRGTDTNIRDVIWDRHQGQVRITTHWHKSRNITRKERSNLRFLPPNLSHILVFYILYVIPVYIFLRLEYLEEKTTSPFLFEINERRIQSSTLSRTLYLQSGLIFRVGLTLNPYRHLINHILLEKLGNDIVDFLDLPNENIESTVEEEDTIIDIQANRTTRTAQRHYSLLVGQATGGQRHLYAKVVHFSARYQTLFHLDKLDDRFVETESRVEPNVSTIDSSGSSIVIPYYSPENLVPKLDIYYELSSFFRDKRAEFRDSYQREAVFAIFEGLTYLTYINKTGSGKSLLYLLPAFCAYQDTVNVVMTTRISLKDDLFFRAQERKIRAVKFEDITAELRDQNRYQPFNLVLASIESIEDSTFTKYLTQLTKSGRSLRIFLDEVHTIILEKNFRWVMKYAQNLLQYRVPLIFISATLPVPLLRLVENEFLLPPNSNRVIRSQTIRENIEYRIIEAVNNQIEFSDIESILENFKAKGLGPGRKAIIFVTSYSIGHYFSEKLSLPFYNTKDPEKEKTLHSFLTNDTVLTMFATSALSLGVDFDVVRFTLHLPPFYGGLIEFIQGSSRIRRDGISIILQQKRSFQLKNSTRASYDTIDLSKITTIDEFRKIDRLVFQKLLNEDRCIRQIVSFFLDNIDIGSCVLYNLRSTSKLKMCYICQRKQDLFEAQTEKEEAIIRSSNVELAYFEDRLENFKLGHCLFCLFLVNVEEMTGHPTRECKYANSERYQKENGISPSFGQRFGSLKNRLALHRGLRQGSCCFSCLIPSRVCASSKQVREETNDRCVYSWVIKAWIVILEIRLELPDAPAYISELKLEEREVQRGLLEYLKTPIQLYGTDAIQACKLLNDLNITRIVHLRETLDNQTRRKRNRESR